ncbi:MAG: M23 family metallopeptidase [Proteobacteria bacterium]|nr:M23 family metallopeptidase [Pseudomonadota bacterium]
MSCSRSAIGFLIAAAFASVAQAAWPPQLPLEMRVPFDPTAFPSGDRQFLTYELYVSNFDSQPVTLQRIEVLDANSAATRAVATFEARQLNPMLHHMGKEIVGDEIPVAGDDSQRQLAAGETVVVYLNVPFERAAQLPTRLRHRVLTDRGTVDAASIATHNTQLRVLAPPLEGSRWRADSGPGNDSHHRRQIMMLNGAPRVPSRYAIDWMQSRNDKAFSGDEHSNKSYFAYGKPVLAVANAQVIAVKDGIAENVPGHFGTGKLAVPMSLDTICGNLVVLDLGGSEFAGYYHLQPGSLRVKVGDRVQQGQVLAEIGNSGGSFEPHLHFEVTNDRQILGGEGLPYILDRYRVTVPGRSEPQGREHELPLDGMRIDFVSR